MSDKFRKFLVTFLVIAVVVGVSAFAGYFIYDFVFGGSNNPSIGGNPHNQNIYEINKYNGFNTFPTKGEPRILVIPVSFDDYKENSTQSNLDKIERVFFVEDDTKDENFEKSNTSWYSVAQYYYLSSGKNLKIKGKVTDWFSPGITTRELLNYRTTNPDYKNSGEDGTWWLLNEAVEWYKNTYSDSKNYDTDGDNFFDLVWLVYNAPHFTTANNLPDVFWAFTYTNLDNYYLASKNNILGYNYCFASYDFIFEGYGKLGYDAHTYIHETGHALGLNDYYSIYPNPNGPGSDSYPYGGVDMMDLNIGDHCSFSKYKLGWTSPKQVISEPGEYKMQSTSDSGDFFIVSNSFAGHPFDEYFVVEYITPTGINYMDYRNPYKGNNLQGFSKPGIRISHVDSRGVRLVNTGNDYTFTHETNYNLINGVIIDNSTRDPIYKLSNGKYCQENVIMQKDYTTFDTSVLSPNYPIGRTVDSLLFYENEVFTLNGNSQYRNLMPSKSNLLNKGIEFNFTIKVVSLGTEAVISVY